MSEYRLKMLLLKIIGVYVFIYWSVASSSVCVFWLVHWLLQSDTFPLALFPSVALSRAMPLVRHNRDAIRYQDCRESIVYIKKLIVHSDSMCVNRTLSTYVIFFILIVFSFSICFAPNATPFTFIRLPWNAVAKPNKHT